MRTIRHVYLVEFVASDGTRFEYDHRGWRLTNVRQLGESERGRGLELIAKAEDCAATAVVEASDPNPLLTVALHVSRTLEHRITHRRAKNRQIP
jgi:hypothetical protein